MQRPPPEDFLLKETNPHLGGGKVTGDKHKSAYDLVQHMPYLYVRVVKARDLPEKDVSRTCDPYVEVNLGNCKGSTPDLKKKSDRKWNQVFAFSKERLQSSELQVTVKDKNFLEDDFIGRVLFDLNKVPSRVPPDSPVAPKWYDMVDKNGEKAKGELKLALWTGTQADEAFPEAWKSEAAGFGESYCLASMRSKVYLHPKLWYLRVSVIEAQDLQLSDEGWFPVFFVRATLGNQQMITSVSQSRTINPKWNEDLMFVAAEPFEDQDLILSVENRVAIKNDEVVGKCTIPLQSIDRRLDNKPVNPEWNNLQKNVIAGEEQKETIFSSRIHIMICLEGGYHVLDDSPQYMSDLRPAAKQLWKPSIGVLELGILYARGLMPMKAKDGRGTTDAYCVAKYGHKWVRTRTIIDSFTPRWNEQYTWEVCDPCTVITIGVFDNRDLHGGDKAGGANDSRIGKLRIRLSNLEMDRVYSQSYPLFVLHPSGVKKMGEIHLVVRFTCFSLLSMMHMYSHPLLPTMHYLHPLTVSQLDKLRHQATQIVSMRLSRAEPPLRKEVVEYMLDVDWNKWSLRKSKANFFRLMAAYGTLRTSFP
ncbi:hypothetical protein I3843_09G032900 [Carya illinoinensis]|nr:hypothetical protein I3843_09G032900 [Carya illinoinensis]